MDELRIGRVGAADPPVDEVEVVGRLVDGERAGILAHPVPAVEVAGAVLDVDVPVEVDVRDAPDASGQDKLADEAVLRVVAVVERARHLALRGLLRLADADAVLPVRRHRLLRDDVQILLQRLDDVVRVEAVLRHHKHRIWLRLLDHPVELLRHERRDARRLRQVTAADLEAQRVDVQQTHQLRLVPELAVHRLDPHLNRAA